MKNTALAGVLAVLGVLAGTLGLPTVERYVAAPPKVREVVLVPVPSATSSVVAAHKPPPTVVQPPVFVLVSTSTPDAAPVSAALATGVGLSVGQTLLGLPASVRNARLDDMASLGITWLRFDIEWSDVQPKNSQTFDWARIDALVAAANARHIEVLPILVYAPRWARSDGCSDSVRCAPKDPAQFGTFAAAAAARYAPQGVHQWEIWNEENLAASWLPQADATQYAALLKAASEAIKKVDPTAAIVVGGMGPAASRNGDIAPVEFLAALYGAGGKESFSAVGFHPYSFPANPGYPMSWNAWQQMTNTSPSLRSVMTKNGDSDKKIWVTEYGTPTGGPGGMSEDAQASMIKDAFKLWHSYSFVGPLMLYTYKDMGTNPDTKENFFGLVRYDGNQKPAYAALKELLKNM